MVREYIEVWMLVVVLYGSQHLQILKTEIECLQLQHEIIVSNTKKYNERNVRCQRVVEKRKYDA
jgi:hypothetical protein